MSNLTSNIYIGYVVEIIYKDNKPTLDLRVRVPSLHGSASMGIPDDKLPIAKPMIIPGTNIISENFKEFINKLNKVYVIFESGSMSKPIYLGLKGNSLLYEYPLDVNTGSNNNEHSGIINLGSIDSINTTFDMLNMRNVYRYDVDEDHLGEAGIFITGISEDGPTEIIKQFRLTSNGIFYRQKVSGGTWSQWEHYIPEDILDWVNSLNISSPQDGDVLMFNSLTNKWENKPVVIDNAVEEVYISKTPPEDNNIKLWIKIHE